MKFLVELEAVFPHSVDDEARAAVVAAERRRGRELRADGTIEHIYRIPGTMANVAIWDVPDADALHELLRSLPAYPYVVLRRVQALATHPLERPGA